MYFPDDSLAILQRAVNTTGDSDSIACIAGSLAGAHNGLEGIPSDWLNRLEYRSELEDLIAYVIERIPEENNYV